MWNVEVRVESPQTGEFKSYTNQGRTSILDSRESAIKWGTQEVRKHYKTCWSQEIEHINSTIFSEGVGIVAFINYWKS